MDDMISRRAAIDAVHEEFDECTVWDESGEYTADAVERILDDLPPVQSEIIRCKDCLMHGVCRFEQGLGLDGYCSQAERRTDG